MGVFDQLADIGRNVIAPLPTAIASGAVNDWELGSNPITAPYQYFKGITSDTPQGATDTGAAGGPVDFNKLTSTLTNIANQYGVDPRQYLASIDVQRQLASATGTTPEDFNKSVIAQAPKLVAQIQSDAQDQQTQRALVARARVQEQSDRQFAIALQAQTQQYFQPFIQNILQSGQTSAAALDQLAAQAPAGFGGVFAAQAQQALASSQRLAGAYGMQAALTPQTYYAGIAAQNQVSALDAARTQQAQAIANYYAQGTANFGGIGGGSSSGGSGSFDDFLATQQQQQQTG